MAGLRGKRHSLQLVASFSLEYSDDSSIQQGIRPCLCVPTFQVTARPNDSPGRSPQTIRQALGLCPSASPTYFPRAKISSTPNGIKLFCLVSSWQAKPQPPIYVSWHQLQLASCHKAAVQPACYGPNNS